MSQPITMPCTHALERLKHLKTAQRARRLAWPAWEHVVMDAERKALRWANAFTATLGLEDILAQDWVVE